MSRVSTSRLAAIGAALLLTACTTTIDDARATRGQAVDTQQAAASPALPWPPPSTSALPRPRALALQSAMQRIAAVAASAGMRGVTAAVVTPQGSWAGAAGVDGDGAALVPESMMGVAEITNTVTAAEVLLLAQDGRIDLDAALSEYLDSPLLTPLPNRGTTVRQALSHTSGLPDYVTTDLLTALRADPTRSWNADQALSYAPIVTRPRFPDSGSMSDYLLLGLLVGQVTGVGYTTAVQRDLLSGNGDERIVVQDAQLPSPPLAAPDDSDDLVPDGHFLPNRAIASAGGSATGIAADAGALARWGYRLYGGLVLSPERTAEMSTPVTDRYGLGSLVVGDDPPGDLDYRLGGIGAIGHAGFLIPGYQALLLVVPHDQLSVAVLTVAPSAVGTIESPIIVADLIDALRS